MSDPGAPPPPGPYGQDPYGQNPPPNPYGQAPPPPNPYGQAPPPPNPYEPSVQPAAPYGAPYGGAYGVPTYPYASWIRRVGGYVVDYILTTLTALPAIVLFFVGIGLGTQDMTTYTRADGSTYTEGDWNSSGTAPLIIGIVLCLVPLAFFIWNYFIKQGRTGRTIGKGVVDIKLISEATGQPIGAGMAFVRQICHILDGICYIGYLWPLWDAKRQTFADKIMKTVVINEPKTPTIP